MSTGCSLRRLADGPGLLWRRSGLFGRRTEQPALEASTGLALERRNEHRLLGGQPAAGRPAGQMIGRQVR